MADLIPISAPHSPERRLDVVFVHGLGGDPLTTWRSGDDDSTSWPDWLAREFGERIGVWSLGYAAAPTYWVRLRGLICGAKDPEAGASMSLSRRAENALDRLVLDRIGQRPVCFIAHSLGGLLAKSILRRAADSLNAPERRQVVEQCRGVLFLATPHQGSRLADFAAAIKLYLPSVCTLGLKDNDDYLRDLYEWYRDYAPSHQIITRSYCENKKTKEVDVVLRSSADPGVTGETARGPTPLDSDHLEISKPRDRNDQAYLASKELIALILQNDSPTPTVPSPSPSPPLSAAEGPHALAAASTVVLRSFLPGVEQADTLIDLSDLFFCADPKDRRPKHPHVWTRDLPGRLAAAVATIERLPRPVGLSPLTHLSIAWYLGTLLDPKRGVPILLGQRSPAATDAWWDGSQARLPSGGAEWTFERMVRGEGRDLALVLSPTHDALRDVQAAIDALGLSVGEIHHARLPHPSRASIRDGGHARWLADALTTRIKAEVTRLRPERLHLFPACPVSLAFLLGQQADVLGFTTVYEFSMGDAQRTYTPGMATGL
jgi:hypothetical protein